MLMEDFFEYRGLDTNLWALFNGEYNGIQLSINEKF